MKGNKFITLAFAVLFIGQLLPAIEAGAEESAASLVGSRVTNFSLSSDQGRLVNYGRDYYGKHHLVITFFPAAFTPV